MGSLQSVLHRRKKKHINMKMEKCSWVILAFFLAALIDSTTSRPQPRQHTDCRCTYVPQTVNICQLEEFCYVPHNSPCSDKQDAFRDDGLFFSYQACENEDSSEESSKESGESNEDSSEELSKESRESNKESSEESSEESSKESGESNEDSRKNSREESSDSKNHSNLTRNQTENHWKNQAKYPSDMPSIS